MIARIRDTAKTLVILGYNSLLSYVNRGIHVAVVV